jgi:hypothetical protein
MDFSWRSVERLEPVGHDGVAILAGPMTVRDI